VGSSEWNPTESFVVGTRMGNLTSGSNPTMTQRKNREQQSLGAIKKLKVWFNGGGGKKSIQNRSSVWKKDKLRDAEYYSLRGGKEDN